MSRRLKLATIAAVTAVALVVWIAPGLGRPESPTKAPAPAARYEMNDSHLHLTNYVQEGPPIQTVLAAMGTKVGRAALFGIPLQQTWSYRLSGEDRPTYYLQTDADLYYYGFTDAFIAETYRSLPKAQQARFDPMITGFNPADMYAADHVRRVLETYPGVFVGIGEFSIHKEFVTSKVAGEAPSVTDPALDRLFRFAGEVGLVVLVHCDADTPFPKAGKPPAYWRDMVEQFRQHPNTTFIWAHVGLGRVVRPFEEMRQYVEELLADPGLRHVHFDLSWTETAKYLTNKPDSPKAVAAILAKYPDRFLFGTDEVGPTTQDGYLANDRLFEPVWKLLPPSVLEQVRVKNYERLFDRARMRVRAWENVRVRGAPARGSRP